MEIKINKEFKKQNSYPNEIKIKIIQLQKENEEIKKELKKIKIKSQELRNIHFENNLKLNKLRSYNNINWWPNNQNIYK